MLRAKELPRQWPTVYTHLSQLALLDLSDGMDGSCTVGHPAEVTLFAKERLLEADRMAGGVATDH